LSGFLSIARFVAIRQLDRVYGSDRREERLRRIAEARTKIEARAKERHAREMDVSRRPSTVGVGFMFLSGGILPNCRK